MASPTPATYSTKCLNHRHVLWTWRPCPTPRPTIAAPLCHVSAPPLSVVEHQCDQPALRPSPHSPRLPAPILSARARRARPRHGQPGGACYRQRSCSSIAPFSSLTPPSASRGSRRATLLPLGRCAAPPRGRRSEAAAVSPAHVARRPRTSTGPAVGGHRSASPPCSFRAAPSPSVAGSRPARPPAVFPPARRREEGEGEKFVCAPSYMTGGPGLIVGPSRQFKQWQFRVHSRVHLADLGLGN
jgi:hypothetical protein